MRKPGQDARDGADTVEAHGVGSRDVQAEPADPEVTAFEAMHEIALAALADEVKRKFGHA